MAESQFIKVVVVGNRMVGKTCLLYAFSSRTFLGNYKPVAFQDNHTCPLLVDGATVNLKILITAGQEDCEKLRLLSYHETNVFLLCFSISSETSYNNILTEWQPELKHHCPGVPYVLVATKADLRQEETADGLVTPAAGKKLSSKINAYSYIECSSKTGANLKEVFEEAVRAVLQPRSPKRMVPTCKLF